MASAERKRARPGKSPPRAPAVEVKSSYPGKLRIIGGRWRGRRLSVPESEGLRPTPDRVRETLFNWLQTYIGGAHCLDLFAGTGALCLEALSRGAARVVMVEKAPAVAERLRQQLVLLQAQDARVTLADAVDFLQQTPEAFDIIFLDPPFKSDLIAQCAKLVEIHGWIKPGGLIYIEAPSQVTEFPLPSTWELLRSKKAGQVGYHLARKKE
ncbi:MAG: 16S rRNA (guanine(966)-N(2))-methyltransferase RsmD [Gammaproteobacteria bacterium]|nr:16S rRNA (guanine(966)-N(2))-methyltransferase RsmD [Gammaproteobacteria bacterium]